MWDKINREIELVDHGYYYYYFNNFFNVLFYYYYYYYYKKKLKIFMIKKLILMKFIKL
jgi:hypothetical protein